MKSMFKLKTGYLISGIVTGLILIFTFFSQLPDGKLHIVFCDVGQGDAAYIRFPGGTDMLIDGGPGGSSPKVLGCLSRHMPFYDRTIDIMMLSHPQEDHLGGLQEIVKRYTVKTFVHSDSGALTQGFQQLQASIAEKHIPERIVATGEDITVGASHMSILWPQVSKVAIHPGTNVLGVSNVNEACIVLRLSYGTFDALFMGDADSGVDPILIQHPLSVNGDLEVLKVPHHGAKTGMTAGFFSWVGGIDTAVISVGKNTYGHPAQETIAALEKKGATIERTDQQGDIEVVTDGKIWTVTTSKTK